MRLNPCRLALMGLLLASQPTASALAQELDVKVGPLFGILRGAVTGQRVSPPLFETMEIMGRERVLAQADRGIEVLQQL